MLKSFIGADMRLYERFGVGLHNIPDVKEPIISSLLVIPCHASSHYGQVWTMACRRKKSRFLSRKVRSLEASCKSGKMLRASSRNVM